MPRADAAGTGRRGSLERVLVMRYRFIGDSVLLGPFLKNLRRLEPRARIDLLVAPFSGQVLANCPYVDRILPFAPSVGHRYDPATGGGRRGKWRGYLDLARRVRAARYDGVFVLKRSLSSALVGLVSGAPFRPGFATEGRSLLLTHPVPYDPRAQHEAESFLNVLRGAGYEDVRAEPLELWSSAEETARADSVLEAAGLARAPFAVVHAAASTPGKQWEDDRFVEVCRYLWRRHGLRTAFTGGPADRDRCEALAGAVAGDGTPAPENLCGRTGLRVDIALYRRARLFVGVDSGPMHMAVACGIPVVALFGPTDPAQWGPYEVGAVRRSEVVRSPEPCGPCRHETCPDRRCMRAIATAAVLAAVDRRLGAPTVA
ncbi:MAG TPA: glycosyltransferase family 9 protein [Thermodesulfobacteriota bacterium]